MAERSLFLVSTPLNLFGAIMVALQHRDTMRSRLYFIDQYHALPNAYFTALQEWQESPFEGIGLFDTRCKSAIEKYRLRKDAFRILGPIVQEFAPTKIYTGNDRRIEFVFAHSIARKINPNVRGGYLDDGVYSYVAHKMGFFQDTFAELLIKKLIYGNWYTRHKVVGGSSLVQEGVVAFPEFANAYIKRLQLSPLNVEWMQSPAMKSYASILLKRRRFDASALNGLKTMVTLPHASVMQNQKMRDDLAKTVARFAANGPCGIKYHPRQEGEDALGLLNIPQTVLIPAGIAFELLLPYLPQGCVIVGDVSTTLLTARWLRPDLNVWAVARKGDARQQKLADLFSYLGINLFGDVGEKTVLEETAGVS